MLPAAFDVQGPGGIPDNSPPVHWREDSTATDPVPEARMKRVGKLARASGDWKGRDFEPRRRDRGHDNGL